MPMPVSFVIDEARSCVFVTPSPTARGSAVTDVIVRLVQERPELANWNWVHDLRDTSGEADQSDVNRVAEAFLVARNGVDAKPCVTVFITLDRAFPLWAKVMDGLFPGRQHLTATTPQRVVSMLCEPHR